MKSIKKGIKLTILLLLLSSLVTACQQDVGVKDELNQRLANIEEEHSRLLDEYNELVSLYESLEGTYNQLIIETEEWRQLTDKEKEDFLNGTQDTRIIEDANLEGTISLQELLLEAEQYDGKFVEISSKLRPMTNDVDRKSFSTVLKIGPQTWDMDSSFTLEVVYSEMENWKELGTMTLDKEAIIRVEGTFFTYGNKYNKGYLEASKITFIN